MARSIECTFKQALHGCKCFRYSFKTKLSQNKTLFLISGKHAGRLPGLGRGPTPPCRGVASMATFKEMRSWESGFPSLEEHDEHEEHGHEEDECKDQNLILQKLRFHAMNSKTWTWVPILEDPMKTNTKAWILMQTFGSNRAFIQEHMNTTYSF